MTDLALTPNQTALAQAGEIANEIAGESSFADYQERRAANTNRRNLASLALFADYLRALRLSPGELATDPAAWQGITWGLVEGFTRWQLGQGYAVGSINVRLSTIKTYAKLAMKAGAIDATAYALIRSVSGYAHREQARIDTQRAEQDIPTRKGSKKAEAVTLTTTQAAALKAQPDTPQGRRDALIMCLLLDHGLRVGELARLTVGDFALADGELRFYRPKVDKQQTHRLTADTLAAARAYLTQDGPALGAVLRGSRKGGALDAAGMSERAITQRVGDLGQRLGVSGLSAHDCRHYWATKAARNGTAIDRLQDAGGWSSPAMPLRYVEAARIANEGVKLD